MSLLARTPALRAARVARFSTSAARRSAHGHYEHIPFDYSNKATFAIKLVAYVGTGFGLPFFAAWWQLRKQGTAA